MTTAEPGDMFSMNDEHWAMFIREDSSATRKAIIEFYDGSLTAYSPRGAEQAPREWYILFSESRYEPFVFMVLEFIPLSRLGWALYKVLLEGQIYYTNTDDVRQCGIKPHHSS